MKTNSRLGQGHIEVMLSFTIFVGFLLFIFVFLNPFGKAKSDQAIIKVQQSIINEISSDIGKLNVFVNNTDDCYNNSKILVYGDRFKENQDLNNPRKYTFYFNDIFESGGIPSCSAQLGRNYSIGAYSKEKMIVYKKIQDLKA